MAHCLALEPCCPHQSPTLTVQDEKYKNSGELRIEPNTQNRYGTLQDDDAPQGIVMESMFGTAQA